MMFFHHIHHLDRRRADRFFGQGKVLTAILRKGPTTQSELLEIVDSETLAELEKRRLIKREDKRSDVFALTKRGEMIAKRFQIHEYFTQNISESLSDEEKDQLTTIIEKLHSNKRSEEFAHFHFRGSHFGFDGNHHEKADT
jgi:DNA-binding MarR family transcriptional regulator